MCGIFGYIGNKSVKSILLGGLKTLEYRGYDSAGMVVTGLHSSGSAKSIGEVKNLEEEMQKLPEEGRVGIAHTRWATHGVPSSENAHPHRDCEGHIWVVHNGIIENYKRLKAKLKESGHQFYSETDSEVIAHLVEEVMSRRNSTLEQSVVEATSLLQGAYGIVVFDAENPEKLVAVRMGSPLVLGVGGEENFLSSDVSALIKHTRDVVYLDDGEAAVVEQGSYRVFSPNGDLVDKKVDEVEWSIEEFKKGGHEHYMLKEIMEGPDMLFNSARGRILEGQGGVKLGGLEDVADKLRNLERITIVGCGSAYYAGIIGKYLFEEYAGIPTDVEIGSELCHRPFNFSSNSAMLAISQSGETADTLAALKEAERKGMLTMGVVNVVGSTIARTVDAGVYNHAGPEIGVASTKAFLSQLEVLALIAVFLGRQRRMSVDEGKRVCSELSNLPFKVEKILEKKEEIKRIAEKYASFKDFLYIGRKYQMPIAYEGALKLKEVSYMHAEGYGAGEMKHGPIAMIDNNFPTFAIALNDSVYDKMFSNIEEIHARGGPLVVLATEGDERIAGLAKDAIYLPFTSEPLSPLLSAVVFQLFAYYAGISKGYNVDKPRNLAKSVTVE